MKRLFAPVLRSWLFAYWAVFATLAALGGLTPGKDPDPPGRVPYPFAAVATIWFVFAVTLLVLKWLSHPPPANRWLRYMRSLLSFCHGVFLWILVFQATGTDRPGYTSAVALFGICTFGLLLSKGQWGSEVRNDQTSGPPA